MTKLRPRPGRVQAVLEEYRALVLAQDAETMEELARRWLQVERRLEAQFRALTLEIAELRQNQEPVSLSKLFQMERYRDLLAQALAETRAYARWAEGMIAERQRVMAGMGIESTQALIRESYLEAGKAVARYNLLPVEAVEAMIGFAGNGSPLYDLFMESYPDSIDALNQALITATARGENPRRTAQMMAEAMRGNLQRALVVSRTEQLRAFREAATLQMKESGVVEGWIWRSAKQERTCLACLAMDGTVHELDEELDDHPNGRCFKQPIIKGLKPVEVQSSRAWFEDQVEEVQRAMMGAERFEAWQAGQFEFGDLAQRRENDEWGSHVRVATLDELGVTGES